MAKFTLLIPIHHPNPPDPRIQMMWVSIYRTSDTDAFVKEVGQYLGQCVPIKIVVSDDLTTGEREHFDRTMEAMRVEVSKKLISVGLPVPKLADNAT